MNSTVQVELARMLLINIKLNSNGKDLLNLKYKSINIDLTPKCVVCIIMFGIWRRIRSSRIRWSCLKYG